MDTMYVTRQELEMAFGCWALELLEEGGTPAPEPVPELARSLTDQLVNLINLIREENAPTT